MKIGRFSSADHIVVSGDDESLDDVLKLPHVSGPWIFQQDRQSFRAEDFVFPQIFVVLVQIALDQRQDILRTIPQRRHSDRHDVETVVKVFTEFILTHSPKIAVVAETMRTSMGIGFTPPTGVIPAPG